MFALTEFSRASQRALCLLAAVAIVTAILALGAQQANSALHEGYSVTVMQLQ